MLVFEHCGLDMCFEGDGQTAKEGEKEQKFAICTEAKTIGPFGGAAQNGTDQPMDQLTDGQSGV